MIDLSDGLGGDAGHLAAASKCEIEVDLGAVPVVPASPKRPRGARSRCSVRRPGRRDYELLCTLPGGIAPERVVEITSATGVPLTRIGFVKEGHGVRLRLDGRDQDIRGFDHFA